METITISNRFFRHELNTYSNWGTAFWRELFQNSVDANASHIEIELHSLENGNTFVRFQDNGPGMNEATLRNVYFQLGETSKSQEDTIGGHGRARILTCFAHEKYQIQTQNLICRGQGGHYEIENWHPIYKGCSVEIEISAAKLDNMQYYLSTYLENCQLPCQVSINKEVYTNWLYRRQATRQISFGTLHVTKKVNNRLIVRVRGTSMFTQYLDCDSGIILEIDPQKARDILTVSRDNLKHEENRELQKLTAELAIDNKSISRDCLTKRTDIVGNLRKLFKKGAAQILPEESVGKMMEQGEVHWTGSEHSYVAAPGFIPSGNYATAPTTEENPPKAEYAVHFEDAPKELITAAKRFSHTEISGNRLKMLKAWEAAVVFFLEEIQDTYGFDISYLPGFVFSPQCGGMNIPQMENGYLILINPITKEGKLAFSIHDYSTLYAIGLHECAHIVVRSHNETFAATQTELTRKTLGRMKEFKSRIQSAVQQ